MVLTRKAIHGILLTAFLLTSNHLLARGWGGGPNWVEGPGVDSKITADSELKTNVVRDKQPGSTSVNIAPSPAATPINLPKPPPPEGLPIPIPMPTP